jgi:hypothetical protein
VRVCKPASVEALQVSGLRDACGAFAQNGMRSPGATILARMVSSAILRRLYKGTALEAEAKEYRREYTWFSQFVWLNEYTRKNPDDADRLQQDIADYGEWEAMQRQAERVGASRTPPAGWLPADPRILMLSEERARDSAK